MHLKAGHIFRAAVGEFQKYTTIILFARVKRRYNPRTILSEIDVFFFHPGRGRKVTKKKNRPSKSIRIKPIPPTFETPRTIKQR